MKMVSRERRSPGVRVRLSLEIISVPTVAPPGYCIWANSRQEELRNGP